MLISKTYRRVCSNCNPHKLIHNTRQRKSLRRQQIWRLGNATHPFFDIKWLFIPLESNLVAKRKWKRTLSINCRQLEIHYGMENEFLKVVFVLLWAYNTLLKVSSFNYILMFDVVLALAPSRLFCLLFLKTLEVFIVRVSKLDDNTQYFLGPMAFMNYLTFIVL